MLHESPIDVYRIAEHAKRYVTSLPLIVCTHVDISCLPLLHENPKRDELLDVLIDAGESAWARGAHEVCCPRQESSFPHLAPCLVGLPFLYQRTVVVEARHMGAQLSADVFTAHPNSRVRVSIRLCPSQN